MTSPSPAAARALALLAGGVPLSLLCDLAEPEGPRSREIFEAEREGAEAWWWELAYPSAVPDAVRGKRGRTA
ncbi:MAG: hypothetical protein ACTHOD_02255 [Motilibacteraceae bacterium]